MKKLIWLLLPICILGLQCEKEKSDPKQYDFTGTWVFDEAEGETSLYKRSGKLKNEYGFTIFEDGRFVERKDAGWCGTPPISYADYEGNWTLISDSTLQISVDFWGGKEVYELNIVAVSENVLETTRTNIDIFFLE